MDGKVNNGRVTTRRDASHEGPLKKRPRLSKFIFHTRSHSFMFLFIRSLTSSTSGACPPPPSGSVFFCLPPLLQSSSWSYIPLPPSNHWTARRHFCVVLCPSLAPAHLLTNQLEHTSLDCDPRLVICSSERCMRSVRRLTSTRRVRREHISYACLLVPPSMPVLSRPFFQPATNKPSRGTRLGSGSWWSCYQQISSR